MFIECICSSQKPKNKKLNTLHSEFINQRLKRQQISVLQLIYDDLASRHFEKMLTYENFLEFFDFTGLWGAKLFRQFDQDQTELITLQQFLYGISRTAKAAYEDKIKLLYSFFQDKKDTGIKFKQFTKMLYNYSKEQLKQILIDDGVFLQSTPNLNHLKINISSTLEKIESPDKRKVMNVSYTATNKLEKASSYQNAYRQLIDYKDIATCLQINTNNMTYQIKYSNMNTLVKQFAAKIYEDNKINKQNGRQISNNTRLTYDLFTKWIKAHQKLFQNYYSTFHQQVWCFQNTEPIYTLEEKVQKAFEGKMRIRKDVSDIYVMLVGDALIVSKSKQSKKIPIKVVCLSGLTVKGVSTQQLGFGFQVSHRQQYYTRTVFFLNSQQQQQIWLSHLKIFEGDSLSKNYAIEQVIGTGRFSVVYRCIQKSNDKTYALKSIQTEKLTEHARKVISNESQIMRIINHTNIVKFKETILTKTYIYIIAQYIQGQDLFQYVSRRKSLSEFQSAFIIGQVIQAVNYLHGLEIIHRDLKPENIMVTFKEEQGLASPTTPTALANRKIQKIKIIDFGLANHVSQILKNNEKQENIGGTPNYIAPQLLIGSKPSFKIDNFAIGSILYFLLSGTLPFLGKNQQETLLKTVKGEYNLQGAKWDTISEQAKDLITQLLQFDPQLRIDLETAMNHEWFNAISRNSNANSIIGQNQSSEEQTNCNTAVIGTDMKQQTEIDSFIVKTQQQQNIPFKFPSRKGIKVTQQDSIRNTTGKSQTNEYDRSRISQIPQRISRSCHKQKFLGETDEEDESVNRYSR